jgi:hypothetical protein
MNRLNRLSKTKELRLDLRKYSSTNRRILDLRELFLFLLEKKLLIFWILNCDSTKLFIPLFTLFLIDANCKRFYDNQCHYN